MSADSATPSSPPAVIADQFRVYADQFSTTAETIRRRGEGLAATAPKDADQLKALVASDVEPIVRAKQAEVQAVVADLTEVPATTGLQTDTYKFILETYGWVAICLFGAGLGGIVGGYVASPLIEMLLSNFMSVIVCYIGLPYCLYNYLRTAEASTSIEEKRMMLFYVTVLMGILNGHNLSACYSGSFSPPSFLAPLMIAVVAELVGAKLGGARPILLGACVGGITVVHLILGIGSGSFGFSYLLSTIFQGAIAAAGLQYTLAAAKDPNTDITKMQLVQIATTIFLGALGAYVTGMTKEQADAAAQE